MSYTLGTVRTRVQARLDDTSFDTTTLNQFINDGQRDILNSRRFIFMEDEASLTTTSGSAALTGIPSDFQTALTLRKTGTNPFVLKYVEYEDFDDTIPDIDQIDNNLPTMWYVFAGTPAVYPKADATYTIKMKYIKSPTELSGDSSVPQIPEDFSEALVLAAYKRALEFNDENDKAQMIQIQVDAMINQMDERYKRQAGKPHIMRQPNRPSTWGL